MKSAAIAYLSLGADADGPPKDEAPLASGAKFGKKN